MSLMLRKRQDIGWCGLAAVFEIERDHGGVAHHRDTQSGELVTMPKTPRSPPKRTGQRARVRRRASNTTLNVNPNLAHANVHAQGLTHATALWGVALILFTFFVCPNPRWLRDAARDRSDITWAKNLRPAMLLRPGPESNRRIELLQSSALPLGYLAAPACGCNTAPRTGARTSPHFRATPTNTRHVAKPTSSACQKNQPLRPRARRRACVWGEVKPALATAARGLCERPPFKNGLDTVQRIGPRSVNAVGPFLGHGGRCNGGRRGVGTRA